jgi:hypothetical protein
MSRPNGVNSTFRRLASLAYRGVTRLGASAEPMTPEDLLDAEGRQPDPAVGQVVDQALSADGGPCVRPRTHVPLVSASYAHLLRNTSDGGIDKGLEYLIGRLADEHADSNGGDMRELETVHGHTPFCRDNDS